MHLVRRAIAIATVLGLSWAAPLAAADPVPRGDRVLAIDVGQSQSGGYDAAWAQAAACGIQNVGLSLDWDQIETAPGVFTDPMGALAAADGYFPAAGATLTLTLRPLHNVVKPVPADLASTAFEDPSHAMATRFCAMLDWVMTRLPATTFDALVVGSEYDVYLAAHGGWADYGSFLYQVVVHIRASGYSSRIPRIAAESTFNGYAFHPDEVTAINAVCDVIGVSYYAVGADFDAKDATATRADLDSLLAFASPAKPLCFYQFGCPSAWKDAGGVVHDRTARQADFITTAFAYWDAHPDLVRLLDFTWLHDLDPADLAVHEAYYGSSDPGFIEFLATLGLRTWVGAGAPKPAYTVLRQQGYARGWGDPIGGGGGGGGGGSGTSSGGGGGCGAGGGGAAAAAVILLFGGAWRGRSRRYR